MLSNQPFQGDELIAQLQKNGVTVLSDESVLVGERFYLIGRRDKSVDRTENPRKSIAQLTEGLDLSKLQIVLNHQPNDYEAEASAGVDLVLSGHTHGGQLFPFNLVGEWIGANDFTYGHEEREGTHFIVTSGISNWAMSFKTGCISEYVVIDILGK